MPSLVEFQVPDVALSTDASTGASTVSFDQGSLEPGRAVRISVKADTVMVAPDGPSIPASNGSWRTSSVSNGVGVNGTLSTTAYAEVYRGNVDATSGSLAVT